MNTRDDPGLYAKSETIHPRSVSGRFRRWKFAAATLLVPWWHLAPFLRWDRGPGAPDQAILIDLAGRRAYCFGLEIWPQEIYYLTGILVVAAIALFLISALYGRVWCGFLCWQTVYTDLFVQVERLLIGDRTRRIALDRAPWGPAKLARKAGVHLIWLIISAACGLSFALYFGDAPTMLPAVLRGEESAAVYGAIAVVGGFCYLLAGHAREQVCLYMCPYSRFQAAMFDEHSLIVAYEPWRGEPRGYWRRGQSFAGRGHCIDCRMCVAVCPTGVDIRDGSQLGCIGCGLCIDACDAIMDRAGLPHGLISWDSIASQAARAAGSPARRRLVRPRTLVYGAILAVSIGLIGWSLSARTTTELTVLHERALLYVRLSDGSIRNGYVLKVQNMVRRDRWFDLAVEGLDGTRLSVIGGGPPLKVAADSVGSFTVFVTAAAATGRRLPLTFVLRDRADGREIRTESLFVGPDR
ncbi:cytochrome c oxidase accessory protein CcoG [Phaeospirillum tilakii]|uniref:Cytochrome c oxidase accessory protein CcoG n=1 Tax=Phaeospirillum tilakii TaxID=741673 RepID=A0ABW5CHM0_9PROT